MDLDALAYAVSVAETGNCTMGMALTKNNCFGIMTWPNGVRTGKSYPSTAASFQDFKDIWSRLYCTAPGYGFPRYAEAIRWTGNDNPDVWLATVRQHYLKYGTIY